MRWRVRLFLSWVVVCWATTANAALEYEAVPMDNGIVILLVSGDFEVGDPVERLAAEVQRTGASIITFSSPGGSPIAAMEIGRSIRRIGLPTFQSRSLLCASACSLAFMGGSKRLAESGAIGVHRAFATEDNTSDRDTAVAQVQELTGEIISYMEEMGIDPGLMKFALKYDSSDMRYLSTSEMAQYRVITDSLNAADSEAGISSPNPVPTPTLEARPPTPPPPAQSMDEGEATKFVAMLIEMHTLPPYQAIAQLRSLYGNTVQYYGKPVVLDDVMNDKADYFARWPTRSYRLLYNTVAASCVGGQICHVSGLYEWAVLSLERNRKAAGTASFEYAFTAQPPYRILLETSAVVKRD